MAYSSMVFMGIFLLGVLSFGLRLLAIEITALLLVISFVFCGFLSVDAAFAGLASQPVVLMGSLFVLSSGLVHAGVIQKLEGQLLKLNKYPQAIAYVGLLLGIGFLSSFISNTATVALAIPVVISVAKGFGVSPRRWLLPIAYISVIGGMQTLIGTSTNVLAGGLVPRYQLPDLELFSTAFYAFPLLILGFIFLLYLPSVLCKGKEKEEYELPEIKYDLRSFTVEVVVDGGSPLCGKRVEEVGLFEIADVVLLQIIKENGVYNSPRDAAEINAGDRLLIEGDIGRLRDYLSEYKLSLMSETEENIEQISNADFHEVLLVEQSSLKNKTAKQSKLRDRHRISLLAINRFGDTIRERPSDVSLRAGDILLVQFLKPVKKNELDEVGLVALRGVSPLKVKNSKFCLSVIIFFFSLILGLFSDFPISFTCFAGAIAMILINVISIEQAISAVQWKLLLFIGAIFSFATAIESNGMAEYIGEWFLTYFGPEDSFFAILTLTAITALITQTLSNQATVALMIPVAANTAESIGGSPEAFIMAVTLAGSCCFLTPLEPVILLVMGPGKYSSRDLLKAGIPLLFMSIMLISTTVWFLGI